MKNIKKLLSILLILTLVVGMIGCSSQSSSSDTKEENEASNHSESDDSASTEQTPLMEGDSYRDFTVDLVDGSKFTLSEHEGSVIFLNFWATWCGPCVGEMPCFTGLQKKYGDKLTLIAVNSGEESSVVEKFIEEKGYEFPVGIDTDGSVSSLYPTDGIPYTLIIAPDGTISHIQTGAYDADKMYQLYSEEIDKLL